MQKGSSSAHATQRQSHKDLHAKEEAKPRVMSVQARNKGTKKTTAIRSISSASDDVGAKLDQLSALITKQRSELANFDSQPKKPLQSDRSVYHQRSKASLKMSNSQTTLSPAAHAYIDL